MNGIESPGAVDADLDEPALAKCAQMLRNTRLSDAELFLDDLGETTRGAFTPNQELENPTAHRIAEDVEGMRGAHGASALAGVESGGPTCRLARGLLGSAGRHGGEAPRIAATSDKVLADLGGRP